MKKIIGISQDDTISTNFLSVLCTSLRKSPDTIVVHAPMPNDDVYKFIRQSYEGGVNAMLVIKKTDAPQETEWLSLPTL